MQDYFFALSVITVGCALLAWLSCRLRQPVILGYFLCGVLSGPSGFGVVAHLDFVEQLSRIGVTLLLFLAGLVLHPDRLAKFFKTAMTVTLGVGVFTWILVFTFLNLWGYNAVESHIAALALMFSSTILVIKLLPTTTLHQKRMGSICIAVLIAQDILAVILLMFVGDSANGGLWKVLLWLPAKTILLTTVAIVGEQFVLRPMMRKADQFNEVLVMLCLAWCLGVALLGQVLGIPVEVGAFIAGVAMARGRISLVLSEQLKPLRDFFLMFFFFVLGAETNVFLLRAIWLPAVVLALLIVALRPLWLRWLFQRLGEDLAFAKETGLRLGQSSEFALIVVVAAAQSGKVSETMSQLVQFTTILTMIISSYLVVLKLPTPIGVKAKLHRD